MRLAGDLNNALDQRASEWSKHLSSPSRPFLNNAHQCRTKWSSGRGTHMLSVYIRKTLMYSCNTNTVAVNY